MVRFGRIDIYSPTLVVVGIMLQLYLQLLAFSSFHLGWASSMIKKCKYKLEQTFKIIMHAHEDVYLLFSVVTFVEP
jgi:hypothetical protein